MRRFVELFARLDRTTSTNAKVEAIRDYVLQAPPEDAAWAIAFLSGRRLKRHVGPAALRAWLDRVLEHELGPVHAAMNARLRDRFPARCHGEDGDLNFPSLEGGD